MRRESIYSNSSQVQLISQCFPAAEIRVIEEGSLLSGFVLVVIACGIPALLTLITGAVGIYSITSVRNTKRLIFNLKQLSRNNNLNLLNFDWLPQENPCVSAYSLALNFLLVTCLSGTDIFLFVLGLRTSLLIVYLVATLLQIYFALILFDFYKLQQRILARWKSDQEETSLSEEARKLARES